ncbi:hypothetical protein [Actinoplanes sp. DH11]|uniref:hypothetical protein n=1 Tax=Actinoplanes sp. DH11 TaxID=2857011 RepID=UPI001E5C087F|nr:hypothetical protein [Actinoplanes sp. DH11]
MLTRLSPGNTALSPGNTAPAPAPDPVVAVIGQRSRVASLPQHLPSGWSMRLVSGVDDVRPEELVLLSGATVHDVRVARAVLPRETRLVALIDDWAAVELVAGVLTAGADVCVRGGHPAILAGHLVAVRRRQLAGRWAGVGAGL